MFLTRPSRSPIISTGYPAAREPRLVPVPQENGLPRRAGYLFKFSRMKSPLVMFHHFILFAGEAKRNNFIISDMKSCTQIVLIMLQASPVIRTL